MPKPMDSSFRVFQSARVFGFKNRAKIQSVQKLLESHILDSSSDSNGLDRDMVRILDL